MVVVDGFDPNAQPPAEAFEPLPAGWMAMRIVEEEIRPVKDKPDHAYLWQKLEVDENHHPEFKGRVAFERINLWNSNEQTVQIARRTLTAQCLAAGEMGPTNAVFDTAKLIGKTMAVKLKIRPARDSYQADNEIVGYDVLANRIGGGSRAPQTATPQVPPRTPAPQTAPAQTAPKPGGAAPWKR